MQHAITAAELFLYQMRPLRVAALWHAWVEAERGRFVPWLAVAAMSGVALYFAQPAEPAWWVGAAGLAASLLACVAGWRHPVSRAAALIGVAATAGFLSAQVQTRRALPIEATPTKAVILTGTIRAVDILPEGRRVTLSGARLDPAGPPLARSVRVRLRRGDPAEVAAGDRVQIRSLVRPPAPPAYPGAWDLQRDAFFSGLGASGFALNPVVTLERAQPSGAAAVLQALRDDIARRVLEDLPGPQGAVASTLLTGTTLAIPQADREAFRDAGLAHLLAVAGLHIGIVMGLFMGLTRLGLAAVEHTALHWPTKAIAGASALAAGLCYLLLTGAHVPIMRSFAMACLVTLGIVVGRRALSLRGLTLAAGAIILIAPNEVVGVSFQMSFAAVLALISGYEAMRPLLARLHGDSMRLRVLSHAAALTLTSLLAGTASAPYGAYHFGHVQVYFILANLLAVPLCAFWVMPAGIATLFLMPLGLERLALVPMGWGIEAILWIGRTVSSWPAATLAVPPMPGWGLVVFSAGLAWLGLWRSRARLLGVPVMLAGLLSPLATAPPDLLMSSDARLIAIRDDGYWVQARSGASKFVLDAWRDHLASGPLRPLQDGQPASCTATGCWIESGGLLLLREASRVTDCSGVQLLVSAEPVRGECPANVPYLDRFSVWRDGAQAVWLTADGPHIVSDRTYRGDRPWVPPLPTARRNIPNLPMAATEDLPPAADE